MPTWWRPPSATAGEGGGLTEPRRHVEPARPADPTGHRPPLSWAVVALALLLLLTAGLLLAVWRLGLGTLLTAWAAALFAALVAILIPGLALPALRRRDGAPPREHPTLAGMRERQEALAVAEERLRIAREMHDGMAQVLGYVNTKAQAVGDHLRADRTEAAIEQMDQLASAAREVYSQVREGILSLRTNRSPEADLRTDLAGFIDRWHERTGIPVTTDLELTEDARFSPLAELQLLRIIEEALTNVRRHARAGRVGVTLAQEGNLLVASVEDDGVGFEMNGEVEEADIPAPDGEDHFGIAVMRERAEAVGGTVSIRSSPGRGTRVEARVPLAPPVFREAPVRFR